MIDTQARDFELLTDTGDTWRLSEHRGNVIALLFYPQNETLVCNRQLCSVRDNWNEYLETKAMVVGISPGGVEGHSAFRTKYDLPLTLLADLGRAVTERYCSHLLFPLSFMRGIVVIDAQGVIRSRRTMLRAFRPSDASVIASIYAARFDRASDEFDRLAAKASRKN